MTEIQAGKDKKKEKRNKDTDKTASFEQWAVQLWDIWAPLHWGPNYI